MEEAASDMARLINENCNLIPAPDHTGDTTANRRLANYIANNVAGRYADYAEVHDILGRTQEVESNCNRHKLRLPPLLPHELRIVRCNHKPIKCQKTYIVDNVTTDGTTIQACVYALGFGTGLVYADAHHDSKN